MTDSSRCHGGKEKGWQWPEKTDIEFNLKYGGWGGHPEKETFV